MDLERLCEEYYRMIYGYLLALTGGEVWLAEDLTQETFLRAIRNINRFRGQSKTSTWLCQIAKYSFYQYLSKKNRVKEVDIGYAADIPDELLLEEAYIRGEENERLYRSIAGLEPDTRRVLLLRIKGDLSFREIGELLDRSENWARVTFFRGKQKLILALGSGEGGKGNA